MAFSQHSYLMHYDGTQKDALESLARLIPSSVYYRLCIVLLNNIREKKVRISWGKFKKKKKPEEIGSSVVPGQKKQGIGPVFQGFFSPSDFWNQQFRFPRRPKVLLLSVKIALPKGNRSEANFGLTIQWSRVCELLSWTPNQFSHNPAVEHTC